MRARTYFCYVCYGFFCFVRHLHVSRHFSAIYVTPVSAIEFSVQVNVFTYLNPKLDYSQRYLLAQLLLRAQVRHTTGILFEFGIQSYDLNLNDIQIKKKNEKIYYANNNICSRRRGKQCRAIATVEMDSHPFCVRFMCFALI